jgi:hypothetical protein
MGDHVLMQTGNDSASGFDTEERKNGMYQAGNTSNGHIGEEAHGVAHMLEVAFIGVFKVSGKLVFHFDSAGW